MSKLDDLINNLCPDGVEYKRIDTVAYLHYGKGNNIPKDGGIYPVYGCKGIVSSTSTYNCENQPLVGHIGSAGEVTWGEGKIYATYNATICESNPDIILAKYLYHVLCCLGLKNYVKGSQPFLSTSDFGCVEIPVPPLEVQNEIVSILDKFTSLEAELEAELEARRKQYEYYRDSLLTFGDDVELKSLSEVTTSIKKIKWKQETNSYQYIDLSSVDRDTHSIGETTNINPETAPSRAQQIVNENDVLFGGTRPMLKRFCLISDKYNNQICSTGFCVLRANPEKILPKWIYYNLGTDAFYKHVEQYQSGASYPAISDGDVKRYKIAIPSLEEQEKIINLLDRFESLCNDITSGLPAEIEARHKQYEYYRDKLLTFKRKEV